MLSFAFTVTETYLQFHCNINKQISICSLEQTCVARDILLPFDWTFSSPRLTRGKNLQTQNDVFASASSGEYSFCTRIFKPKGEHPSVASHVLWVSSKLKPMVDIQKKCRTMKTNNNISNNRGRTSTSGFNQIKKVVKVLVIFIGSIIVLVLWVFLRPIFRGVGWVISRVSALMIIFWLLTL